MENKGLGIKDCYLAVRNKSYLDDYDVVYQEIPNTDLICLVAFNISENSIAYLSKSNLKPGSDASFWFERAQENTLNKEGAIMSLLGFMGVLPSEEETDLEVLVVNPMMNNGAWAFKSPKVLDKVRETLNTDKIVLLPSSIHELLAMDYNKVKNDLEEVRNIVREINKMLVVDQGEYLSDNIYFWDGTEVTMYK